MAKSRYTSDQKSLVQAMLKRIEQGRDDLPYSRLFAELFDEFRRETGLDISEHDFWRLVLSVAKRGGIRGKKRRRSAILVSDSDAREIMALAPEYIGSRDRLPYTTVFEEMYDRFRRKPAREGLSRHDFWRMVSAAAKRSHKPEPIFSAVRIELPKEMVARIHAANPWWKSGKAPTSLPFRRWAFNKTLQLMQLWQDRAVAIRGPRQVGKTTLQMQIIQHLIAEKGVDPKRILRIQFDQLTEHGIADLMDPILTIAQWYEKTILRKEINESARWKEPIFIFFDELQYVKLWAPGLKFFVDHHRCHVLITGSSSLRITEGQESLAGRISMIDMGPMRLSEIAGLRGLAEVRAFHGENGFEDWKRTEFWNDLVVHGEKERSAVEKAFRLFSEFGGFPRCHHPGLPREDVSQILVEDVVNRTIDWDLRMGRGGRARDRTLIQAAFRAACIYAGQAPRAGTLAEIMTEKLERPVKPEEVADDLQFLDDAMLIRLVNPLPLRLKRETNPPKLCLCDHALRAAWLQETVPLVPEDLKKTPHLTDLAGHLIESILGYYLRDILLEVAHFPKRGREPEVDFILTVGDQRIPIEVKYRNKIDPSRDTKGLRYWIEKKAYNAPFGLLITQDVQSAKQLPGNIIAVPAKYLLLLK